MRFFKSVGLLFYGLIASYLLWLLFYWLAPHVMSVGWDWFYCVYASGWWSCYGNRGGGKHDTGLPCHDVVWQRLFVNKMDLWNLFCVQRVQCSYATLAIGYRLWLPSNPDSYFIWYNGNNFIWSNTGRVREGLRWGKIKFLWRCERLFDRLWFLRTLINK